MLGHKAKRPWRDESHGIEEEEEHHQHHDTIGVLEHVLVREGRLRPAGSSFMQGVCGANDGAILTRANSVNSQTPHSLFVLPEVVVVWDPCSSPDEKVHPETNEP